MADIDDDGLSTAVMDEAGLAARKQVCATLTDAFRNVGELLWVSGYIVGGDRVDGSSPFGFGTDATVGLSTVLKVAGELMGGTSILLAAGNTYAAAALIRQLVEVEYLAWAFAEDHKEAAHWLRATPEDRLKMWQPRHIRQRSNGRFRTSSYAVHCERGGHPTPQANTLLPGHSDRTPPEWQWADLANHGHSAWEYSSRAIDALDYGKAVRESPHWKAVAPAVAAWATNDPFRRLALRSAS